MSADSDFNTDLARGKWLEGKVAERIGAQPITEFRHRDIGDLFLPEHGLLVECKRDEKWEQTGNIALELADLEPANEHTILTGVLKHARHRLPTVIVHGLGKRCGTLLVYSPYWMVTTLATHPPERSRFTCWRNGNGEPRPLTAGLIVPGPGRPTWRHWYGMPTLPVIEATPQTLRAAVIEVGSYPIPKVLPDEEALYSRLASNPADQVISQCLRRFSVKGQVDDSVHALLRGEQAPVG